jgi:hypothetical protein
MGDYYADAVLDTQAIPFEPLVAAYAPSQAGNITGQTELHATLKAAANLRVTGSAAQPVILGRINLNGGDLIFRGNRYVLQGGTTDFVNPSQTEPVVNVTVNTEVQQYNVRMHFLGAGRSSAHELFFGSSIAAF